MTDWTYIERNFEQDFQNKSLEELEKLLTAYKTNVSDYTQDFMSFQFSETRIMILKKVIDQKKLIKPGP